MTSNLSKSLQVVKTGADLNAASGEFIFDVNAKVTNDMHWLDGVTADRECDISYRTADDDNFSYKST